MKVLTRNEMKLVSGADAYLCNPNNGLLAAEHIDNIYYNATSTANAAQEVFFEPNRNVFNATITRFVARQLKTIGIFDVAEYSIKGTAIPKSSVVEKI